MAHIGPRKTSLVIFLWKRVTSSEIIINNIVSKKTTELVFLFHKDITKLVFLWPNYLDSQISNIKLLNEIEESNVLPFLDVKITKRTNKFVTSVFIKPTFTELSSDLSFFNPFLYKINFIKTSEVLKYVLVIFQLMFNLI